MGIPSSSGLERVEFTMVDDMRLKIQAPDAQGAPWRILANRERVCRAPEAGSRPVS
jgi:hypothetical protein